MDERLRLAITGLHFHHAWIMIRMWNHFCVPHDSAPAIVFVSALLSGDCMCFNVQELQLQLEKAILETVILKGSAHCHCKVLAFYSNWNE